MLTRNVTIGAGSIYYGYITRRDECPMYYTRIYINGNCIATEKEKDYTALCYTVQAKYGLQLPPKRELRFKAYYGELCAVI